MLAAGVLALAAAAGTISSVSAADLHYNYTVQPAGNPFVLPSGGFKQMVWVNDYIPQGSSLLCRWKNATAAFVEFQYGGRGFCISGTLPPEAFVRVDPPYTEQGIAAAAQRVVTDGSTFCMDLEPSFKRIRFFGAVVVDTVSMDMVADLPQGYTADDLRPQTYPMVKDGAPDAGNMFSFGPTAPTVYTLDGHAGVNFRPPGGTVSIATPPNAAFFVLNGGRAANMTLLLVSTQPKLPVDPGAGGIIVGLRAAQYPDVPLLLLPLDPARNYTITIAGEGDFPGGTGFNLTSATFYQFDGTPTTSIAPSGTGGPSPAKKKTNVAAIAGGAAGGAAALLVLLVLLFFLYRHRKKATPPNEPVDPFMPQHTGQYPDPTPFPGQFTTSSSLAAPATSHYTQLGDGALVTALPSPSKTTDTSPRYSFSTQPAGPTPSPAHPSASSHASSRPPDSGHGSASRILHEQDALDAAGGVTRLPPLYNPAWQAQAQPHAQPHDAHIRDVDGGHKL